MRKHFFGYTSISIEWLSIFMEKYFLALVRKCWLWKSRFSWILVSSIDKIQLIWSKLFDIFWTAFLIIQKWWASDNGGPITVAFYLLCVKLQCPLFNVLLFAYITLFVICINTVHRSQQYISKSGNLFVTCQRQQCFNFCFYFERKKFKVKVFVASVHLMR